MKTTRLIAGNKDFTLHIQSERGMSEEELVKKSIEYLKNRLINKVKEL